MKLEGTRESAYLRQCKSFLNITTTTTTTTTTLWPCIYLALLWRYGASKKMGSRPWSFRVTWCHWSRDHSTRSGRLPIGGSFRPYVYLAPLRTQTHGRTHTRTHRMTNLIISSNVHFVPLAEINITWKTQLLARHVV